MKIAAVSRAVVNSLNMVLINSCKRPRKFGDAFGVVWINGCICQPRLINPRQRLTWLLVVAPLARVFAGFAGPACALVARCVFHVFPFIGLEE